MLIYKNKIYIYIYIYIKNLYLYKYFKHLLLDYKTVVIFISNKWKMRGKRTRTLRSTGWHSNLIIGIWSLSLFSLKLINF